MGRKGKDIEEEKDWICRRVRESKRRKEPGIRERGNEKDMERESYWKEIEEQIELRRNWVKKVNKGKEKRVKNKKGIKNK